MADKNWQTGSKDLIPATAIVCLVAIAPPQASAWAAPGDAAPASYFGSLDPLMVWELVIGGIVVAAFLAAIALWVLSSLKRARRSQLRRNVFISSALNHLNQGVMMTDPKGRIVFCNDQYLEIYGLVRADVPNGMEGQALLEMRRRRGVLDVSVEDFYTKAAAPEGLVTELPNGKAVLVRYFTLPNGGSVATHLDCTDQRKMSRKLASTTQFLESVLDNVPVCVAAKSIQDG